MSSEQTPSAEEAFAAKIDNLGLTMAIFSRSSIYDAAKHIPELVTDAQQDVAALAGRVIMAETTSAEYFVPTGTAEPAVTSVRLDNNRNDWYDFAGILLDLQDIDVPRVQFSSLLSRNDDSKTGKILCLQVGPLGDRLSTTDMEGFFRARTLHPFGVDEHAGQPLWVPVRPLREKTLRFPDSVELLANLRKSD